MKQLLLMILLMSNISLAANLENVSNGENISSNSFNKVVQVLNKVLDIQIPIGENSYTARIGGGGSVSSENTDWISGSAGISDTNRYNLIFNLNMFSVAPNCVASVYQGNDAAQLSVGLDSVSNTQVAYRTGYQINGVFVKYPYDFTVICQRIGSDYKGYKTIRQFLVDSGLSFLQ